MSVLFHLASNKTKTMTQEEFQNISNEDLQAFYQQAYRAYSFSLNEMVRRANIAYEEERKKNA